MFNFTQVIIGRGTSSQMGRKENGVYLGEIRKKRKKKYERKEEKRKERNKRKKE